MNGRYSWNNNHKSGFTFIEMIMSMFVQSIVVMLLIGCLQITVRYIERLRLDKQVEWSLFVEQFERDIKEMNVVAIGDKIIGFKTAKGEPVFYEFDGGRIRRNKNDGVNAVLTEVRDVHFLKGNRGIWVEVTFNMGDVRKGFVHHE